MDDKRALVDIEHHKINFANFLKYKLKCGYSARDFMYYMKRYDNNSAMLHRIDYEEDALTMIEECTKEKIIRLGISTTEIDQESRYNITPIKQRTTLEEVEDEDIDAYKLWLEKLPQDKENPGTNVLQKYISMFFSTNLKLTLSLSLSLYITSIYASRRI
jgi:hypothetical protein